MNEPLTIGRLARAAGVHVETVRYYQRQGLLEEPPKPREGYRLYPAGAVDRIRFIKRAQALGFRLAEIRELLELEEGSCQDVRQRAVAKCRQIERQIADLQAIHAVLQELVEACGEQTTGRGTCPIIATLAAKEEPPR
ncbi:MAG TPA: Hg(II)-responsive transcriptional regulator [Thiotrichales bacterium]|nr:Hg(II)-responsive transcriptional regulator [Thiotrichales bacterium]